MTGLFFAFFTCRKRVFISRYVPHLHYPPVMLFFNEQGNQVLRTVARMLNERMMNSHNFVIEQARLKG